jgi:large subunit ribosomal protein L7e
MSKPNTQNLQLVPEVILKRKHDMDDMKAHRAAQQILNPRGNNKVFSRKTKVIKVHKPETILVNARSQKKHAIRYKRVLRKGMQKRASQKKIQKVKEVFPDDVDMQNEEELKKEVKYTANSVGAKMVFVVRIRDPNGMPKKVRTILDKLFLKSANEGVFARYDESLKKRLHLIEPWVTYGIPSKAMISDLIHRRGHGKVDGKRVPLSDNTIIEKALSDKTDGSVICVEDMVEELNSVGDQFKTVNSFLWTFQLASVHSKFQKEKLNVKDGGDYGDRGEEMDEYIRTML